MTRQVRLLGPSEFYEARDLFRAAVHRAPQTQQEWEAVSSLMEYGRVFGAFADGELAGTTRSFASALRVPGGVTVPAAAVSSVGVRADKTRRGLLTALMHAELRSVRERGEPLAMLHASETGIYGRFGYGPATRTRTVSMHCASTRLRPDLRDGGAVRLVDRETAAKALPELYRQCCDRAGMIERVPRWWSQFQQVEDHLTAVHSNGAGRDDGYVVYKTVHSDIRFGDGKCVLQPHRADRCGVLLGTRAAEHGRQQSRQPVPGRRFGVHIG